MKWNELTTDEQLEQAHVLSHTKTVVIFKHSTRCSISAGALDRIQRNFAETSDHEWFYLDLIRYRALSGTVAQKYNVQHESPQVLVIRNGICVYHASHFDIRYDEVMAA